MRKIVDTQFEFFEFCTGFTLKYVYETVHYIFESKLTTRSLTSALGIAAEIHMFWDNNPKQKIAIPPREDKFLARHLVGNAQKHP